MSGIPVANQLAAGYSETRQIWLYRAHSKEFGTIGPGIEFTPEGCSLIPMESWNDGKMETGNLPAGLSEANANKLGSKE